jgi:catechol-2,3-dioxygenase
MSTVVDPREGADVRPDLEQSVRVGIPVARLNHAVLYVRDATLAADFYSRVFGFEVVEAAFGGRAVFMRAGGGDNHHDLGLFSVGPDAPRPARGSVGLYHLAWEVPTIDDLAAAAQTLSAEGALGGASDHGVSKSLYGRDPDGNEFEIMWRVPREAWGEFENKGAVMPLDLDAEVQRWGAPGAARA